MQFCSNPILFFIRAVLIIVLPDIVARRDFLTIAFGARFKNIDQFYFLRFHCDKITKLCHKNA